MTDKSKTIIDARTGKPVTRETIAARFEPAEEVPTIKRPKSEELAAKARLAAEAERKKPRLDWLNRELRKLFSRDTDQDS